MNDSRIYLLKEAPVRKAVNTMAWPAIASFLVMSIYNIVDTMFVSRLGTEAIGAVQVVMPIMLLTTATGLAFGIGGGSYLSRVLGKGDFGLASRVATTAFYSVMAVGIVYAAAAFLFKEPILHFFGANEDIMPISISYISFILPGAIFTVGAMTLNNLLRAEGSAKLSLLGMAIGSVLNILLDPLFIFVFGWGVAGAAIATSISQLVTWLVLFTRFCLGHTVVKIGRSHFKPSLAIYREIFTIGLPTFLRQLLFSLSIGLLNQGAVQYGGADLLAALGIVSKVHMLPMFILFGLAQGMQPVAGYNIGSGSKSRVLQSVRYTLAAAFIASAVSCLVMVLFSRQLMAGFDAAPSVAAFGALGLAYYALSLLFAGISNTIGVFYQALGKGLQAMLLSTTRQGFFFIPAILLLPRLLGLQGILLAQLAADALTFLLSLLLFVPFIKKDGLAAEIERHRHLD